MTALGFAAGNERFGFPITSIHSSIFLSCVFLRGVALHLVMKQASELRSEQMACRPFATASTAVVPPPQKGSRTISPGFVNSSIKHFAI
jgi:hypothetical protein